MISSSKIDNNSNLKQFTTSARNELIKYAKCLWVRYLYSEYQTTSFSIKLDKINALFCLLDSIESKRLNYSLNEFEVSHLLVNFRSTLAAFKSTCSNRAHDVLFTQCLVLQSNFFKFVPQVRLALQESRRAILLAKNLEMLVDKTQESIYLSLSCQELRLAFSTLR